MKLIFAGLIGAGFSAHTCEKGWSYDGASGCYKVLDTATKWKDAKTACEGVGATLAVPTDSTVSDIIFRNSKETRVWLGVERKDDKWQDLNKAEISYSEFYPGQPDKIGSDPNCMELSDAGTIYATTYMYEAHFGAGWNDESCKTEIKPLCQKSCDGCSPDNGCPAGWTQDEFGDGSNCYKISKDKKSWGEAECECAKTGGHLAHMTDRKANSYYQHLIRKNPESFWIGYRADKKKKPFFTSNLDKIGFSDWIPFTPDNYLGIGEWCVEMRDFGKGATENVTDAWDTIPFFAGWNDRRCPDELKYICQRDLGGATAPLNCTVYSGTSRDQYSLGAIIISLMACFIH